MLTDVKLTSDLNKLSELDKKELENLIHFITGAVKAGLENDEIAAETIAKQINKVLENERSE